MRVILRILIKNSEGNTRTNDHVIFRELRTKPGDLYSKDKVVRTVRELGQTGFLTLNKLPQILKMLIQMAELLILNMAG